MGLKQPAGHRESEEGHVKLQEIAAPEYGRQQQPPAFAVHPCYGGETLPDSFEEVADTGHEFPLAESEQRPESDCRHDDAAPHEGGGQQRLYLGVSRRIGVDKLDERGRGESEGQKCQQGHNHCVGQPVGDHRPEDRREGRFLAVGDVARPPYLSKAGEDDVEGVGAEDGVEKYPEGGPDIYRLELDAPAGRPDDDGDDAYEQVEADKPEVAVFAYDSHHLPEIDVAEEGHAKSHADGQRNPEFQEPASQAPFLELVGWLVCR